ncbi:DUF2020 domain-containing protein [Amycolatopsis sp. CA-230715]|uniref:DUF2020 domain-containing protein n=1 Tax=Amycolatopsis sp. CA-230715 TaxID=2745196 RepID=UPI001C0289DE|nr:DUF2020 domain-containing protein [Amycolatopsis sp. CA-230715]QWF80415.1 hypothetical protein HUW46_03836 [Amycolatopsis sp. CA-230715]
MRRAAITLGAATAVLLAGCSGGTPPAPPAAPPSAPPPAAPVVPPDPQPSKPGPCPYLDNAFVSDANGQRVSKAQVSADAPHPACFFYALTGKLQLTAWVYTGTKEVARALVDKVAPVATSSPATEPPGWQGGYQPTDAGAVYAVAKEGTAVVVTTNQKQTVKARTVVKQVIAKLAL